MFRYSIIPLFFFLVYAFTALSQPRSRVGCSKIHTSALKTTAQTQTVSYLSLVDKYDVKTIDFNLELSALNKNIAGYVVLSVEALEIIDTFAFELHPNFSIDSIRVNSAFMNNITRVGDQCYLKPIFALASGQHYTITIYYHGTAPAGNTWGSGFVNTTAAGNPTTYSLSVPYFTHHWWPCKQVLTDLIDTVIMNIITDTAYTVSSNGLRTSDVDLLNGKHLVTWKTTYPINYYLISVNVGTYIEYNTSVEFPGTGVQTPIRNFVFNPTVLNTKKPILDTLDDFLLHFSDLFGTYPFYDEKFGIIMVNLQGGMEHQTLVNLSQNFDYYLAAHEMAHQWWGDAVNVDNLHDMWLNEGFASYCEYLTAEEFFPSQASGIMLGYHTSAKSSSTQRVYVDDLSDFNTIYNGMVYEKGAAILHTLRYLINNDSLFFNALKTYHLSQQFGHTNASFFKDHMELSTGIILDDFMDEWYYGYGYPKYSLRWNTDQDSLVIRLSQTSTSMNTPVFHVPVEVNIKRTGALDTLIRIEVYDSIAWFKAPIFNADSVNLLIIDPNNDIINSVVSIQKDTNLVGVDEYLYVDKKLLRIYPNPVKELLFIDEVAEFGLLTIRSALGAVLLQEPWVGGSINTSNLSKGGYFVELETKGQRRIAKFLKQ